MSQCFRNDHRDVARDRRKFFRSREKPRCRNVIREGDRILISAKKTGCRRTEASRLRGRQLPGEANHFVAGTNLSRRAPDSRFRFGEMKAQRIPSDSITPFRSKKSSRRWSRPANGSRFRFSAEDQCEMPFFRSRPAVKTRAQFENANAPRALARDCAQARQADPARDSAATRHGLHSTDCAARARFPERRCVRNCAESTPTCALQKVPCAASRWRNSDSKS